MPEIHDEIVELLARHAQAARLEGAREVERLREALREIAMQSDRPAGELPMGWSRLAVDSIHKIAIASLDPLSIAEKGV